MSSPPKKSTWPPIRGKRRRENNENEPVSPVTPTSKGLQSSSLTDLDISRLTSQNPLSRMNTFRNGFLTPSPKLPSHKPYALAVSGRKREKAFAFPVLSTLCGINPLTPERLNVLAHEHGLLTGAQKLRDYQVDAVNCILGRKQDMCVIAPTGAGKSTLWSLPLVAQNTGISLVIVPFTSLGVQGEKRSVIIIHLFRSI